MYMRRVTVPLTTNASGDVTAYSPCVSGRVMDVIYTKGTLDGTTTDITITTATTLQTILTLTNVTASAAYHPRSVVHGNTGTALTGVEPINAADEEIKIVVAQGGNAGAGSVTLIIG